MILFLFFKIKLINYYLFKGVATFREFNGDTDDLEFAHYDRSSKKWWVEVDSIEKDYRERPVVMDCLPILQIGVHYRYILP